MDEKLNNEYCNKLIKELNESKTWLKDNDLLTDKLDKKINLLIAILSTGDKTLSARYETNIILRRVDRLKIKVNK